LTFHFIFWRWFGSVFKVISSFLCWFFVLSIWIDYHSITHYVLSEFNGCISSFIIVEFSFLISYHTTVIHLISSWDIHINGSKSQDMSLFLCCFDLIRGVVPFEIVRSSLFLFNFLDHRVDFCLSIRKDWSF
jgi:hypothetical protein